MKIFTIHSQEELHLPAKALVKLVKNQPIVAFYGEMGVGKTTFIKVICQQLGVKEIVNSPTFAIVNEYEGKNCLPIYHLDLYRVKSPVELLDIGAEEYFYSGNICLIEWPQKGGDALPNERINVYIKELSTNSREIKIEVVH